MVLSAGHHTDDVQLVDDGGVEGEKIGLTREESAS